jgi:tetratricopeptide (TPR) repeat protein
MHRPKTRRPWPPTNWKRALEAGFDHPALYFNLGLLRSKTERTESALRYLGHAVKHVDFALGARLLMGEVLTRMGRMSEASVAYLEALKLADSMVVPEDMPMRSASFTSRSSKPRLLILTRPTNYAYVKILKNCWCAEDWQNHLLKAREQLPKALMAIPRSRWQKSSSRPRAARCWTP